MDLQKVISRKNCVKNQFLAGILKVNDENSRIRIHQSEAWIRGSGSTPKFHGSGTLRSIVLDNAYQCSVWRICLTEKIRIWLTLVLNKYRYLQKMYNEEILGLKQHPLWSSLVSSSSRRHRNIRLLRWSKSFKKQPVVHDPSNCCITFNIFYLWQTRTREALFWPGRKW